MRGTVRKWKQILLMNKLLEMMKGKIENVKKYFEIKDKILKDYESILKMLENNLTKDETLGNYERQYWNLHQSHGRGTL